MAREVPEEESYRRADEESRIQKFNKINKENMAIIGIDFDGTCVTDLFPYVGDNIGAASVLRKLADKNLLILYTVRDGKYLQDAVDWFKYNHINLYSVNYNPEPVSSSPKQNTSSSKNRKIKNDVIMATKKQILESNELLQQKRKAYHLSDEGFEEYKKFLSDPDQKKFCFKGYYYVEVKEQDDKELLGAMGRVVYG